MFGLCGSKTASIPPVFSSFDRTFVHVLPPSAVRKIPRSTRNGPEIVRVRLADDTFDRERAAAAEGTDLSPTHSIEQLFIDHSRWSWGGGWLGSKRTCEKQHGKSENDSNQIKRTVIG